MQSKIVDGFMFEVSVRNLQVSSMPTEHRRHQDCAQPCKKAWNGATEPHPCHASAVDAGYTSDMLV